LQLGASAPERAAILREKVARQVEEKMSDEAMLAQLVRQAGQEGAALVTLRALAEEASELGAERALKLLGLGDQQARRDMDELRELLQAWRDAKKSAWSAVVTWVVRIGLAALVAGMAVKMGMLERIAG
jgi:anti-sigma-K factor RskA